MVFQNWNNSFTSWWASSIFAIFEVRKSLYRDSVEGFLDAISRDQVWEKIVSLVWWCLGLRISSLGGLASREEIRNKISHNCWKGLLFTTSLIICPCPANIFFTQGKSNRFSSCNLSAVNENSPFSTFKESLIWAIWPRTKTLASFQTQLSIHF